MLAPGERTTPIRQNAGSVQIGIRGSGVVAVAGTEHVLEVFDVANLPAMKPHGSANTGDEVWARLSYSNAPLLEKLGVHYAEEPTSRARRPSRRLRRRRLPAAARRPTSRSATGVPGCAATNIVDSEVVGTPRCTGLGPRGHLAPDQRVGDGKRTDHGATTIPPPSGAGRHSQLFCHRYVVPPGKPATYGERGHRHTSVAINYHFPGPG